MSDISQQYASIGISATLSVFDGFRNKAEQERKRLEVERLTLERNQIQQELQLEQELTELEWEQVNNRLIQQVSRLNTSREKEFMVKRLKEQQLMAQPEFIQHHIEWLKHRWETEKERMALMSKQLHVLIAHGYSLENFIDNQETP